MITCSGQWMDKKTRGKRHAASRTAFFWRSRAALSSSSKASSCSAEQAGGGCTFASWVLMSRMMTNMTSAITRVAVPLS